MFRFFPRRVSEESFRRYISGLVEEVDIERVLERSDRLAKSVGLSDIDDLDPTDSLGLDSDELARQQKSVLDEAVKCAELAGVLRAFRMLFPDSDLGDYTEFTDKVDALCKGTAEMLGEYHRLYVEERRRNGYQGED